MIAVWQLQRAKKYEMSRKLLTVGVNWQPVCVRSGVLGLKDGIYGGAGSKQSRYYSDLILKGFITWKRCSSYANKGIVCIDSVLNILAGCKACFFSPFCSIIWFTRTSLILISLIIEYTVASEKNNKQKNPNLLELPRCLHWLIIIWNARVSYLFTQLSRRYKYCYAW